MILFLEFIGMPLKVGVLKMPLGQTFVSELGDNWEQLLDGLNNNKELEFNDYEDVKDYLKNPDFVKRGENALGRILTQHPESTLDSFKDCLVKNNIKRQDIFKFLDSLATKQAKEIKHLTLKNKEKLSYFIGNPSEALKGNTRFILNAFDIDDIDANRIVNIDMDRIPAASSRLIDRLQQAFPSLELKTIFLVLKEKFLNKAALELYNIANGHIRNK